MPLGHKNLTPFVSTIGTPPCRVISAPQKSWTELGVLTRVVVPTVPQPLVTLTYGALAANLVPLSVLYRTGAWSLLWSCRVTTPSALVLAPFRRCRTPQQPRSLILWHRLTDAKRGPATFSLLFRQTQGALCTKRTVVVSTLVSLP